MSTVLRWANKTGNIVDLLREHKIVLLWNIQLNSCIMITFGTIQNWNSRPSLEVKYTCSLQDHFLDSLKGVSYRQWLKTWRKNNLDPHINDAEILSNIMAFKHLLHSLLDWTNLASRAVHIECVLTGWNNIECPILDLRSAQSSINCVQVLVGIW